MKSAEDYTELQARGLIDQIVASVEDPSLDSLPYFDDLMEQAERHFTKDQWRKLEREVEALR